MNIFVLSLMSVGLYSVGTAYQLLAYLDKLKLKPFSAFVIGLIAAAAQLALTWHYLSSGIEPSTTLSSESLPTFDFNLLNSLSLCSAIAALSLVFMSTQRPLHSGVIIVYPICITATLVMLGFDSNETNVQSINGGLFTHIILSILSYCILSLAAVQAVLIAVQNSNLKKRKQTLLIRNLPPLLMMERLLFEMLWLGTGLLFFAILAGFIFVEDLFSQHLAHKTFFSVVALGIFSTLLYGRHTYGWRGAKASKMTLWGSALLMIGFFGTKLVLELIIS